MITTCQPGHGAARLQGQELIANLAGKWLTSGGAQAAGRVTGTSPTPAASTSTAKNGQRMDGSRLQPHRQSPSSRRAPPRPPAAPRVRTGLPAAGAVPTTAFPRHPARASCPTAPTLPAGQWGPPRPGVHRGTPQGGVGRVNRGPRSPPDAPWVPHRGPNVPRGASLRFGYVSLPQILVVRSQCVWASLQRGAQHHGVHSRDMGCTLGIWGAQHNQGQGAWHPGYEVHSTAGTGC